MFVFYIWSFISKYFPQFPLMFWKTFQTLKNFSAMDTLFFLVVAVFFSVIIYKFLTRNFNIFEQRGVKFETPKIIFGNLWKVCLGKETAVNAFQYFYDKFENEKWVIDNKLKSGQSNSSDLTTNAVVRFLKTGVKKRVRNCDTVN